ncbi:hypothetical protein [Hoylesella loescheii]|uniref:Uncharacterized protein n=1 Tax=Hoylesella loescheii DSM 19665 = JCM 12249 = ATCC 15930 TaxID=1122985 RepID=A0A069QL21_HOYLO|nr:hypothetical protein [Hoylesella loescheii]KDR52709.1 hypothetical protein HMPREF1991_01207 [Hoylesella loescheii DSM 19665 = JCM 12249 = ATCC 15930]
MAITIKPVVELLKPFAKQAAEAAATFVIQEGIKKIFEKKETKNKQKK